MSAKIAMRSARGRRSPSPPARRRADRTTSSSTPARTRTTVAKQSPSKVGTCWFDGKHKAFDDYSYAPEAGASSTRILIVPKDGAARLPALVIEVRKAKRGTDVRLFGPLMQTGERRVHPHTT